MNVGFFNNCIRGYLNTLGRQLRELQLFNSLVTVKKAYYKLSLKVHPDRVSADELEQATRKFQALGKIYEVLSDDERRAMYDEDGKQQYHSQCK